MRKILVLFCFIIKIVHGCNEIFETDSAIYRDIKNIEPNTTYYFIYGFSDIENQSSIFSESVRKKFIKFEMTPYFKFEIVLGAFTPNFTLEATNSKLDGFWIGTTKPFLFFTIKGRVQTLIGYKYSNETAGITSMLTCQLSKSKTSDEFVTKVVIFILSTGPAIYHQAFKSYQYSYMSSRSLLKFNLLPKYQLFSDPCQAIMNSLGDCNTNHVILSLILLISVPITILLVILLNLAWKLRQKIKLQKRRRRRNQVTRFIMVQPKNTS
jgi:hypothetical protein